MSLRNIWKGPHPEKEHPSPRTKIHSNPHIPKNNHFWREKKSTYLIFSSQPINLILLHFIPPHPTLERRKPTIKLVTLSIRTIFYSPHPIPTQKKFPQCFCTREPIKETNLC
jgi:hypothetical protein